MELFSCKMRLKNQNMRKAVNGMTKFVPKEKMSKKARKKLDRSRRETWDFPPVTRRVESKKIYNRKKASHDRYRDNGMGGFAY